MDEKPKATANHFIFFFVVIFGAIQLGFFAVVIFPMMLFSMFSLSKVFFAALFFGITILDAMIAAFITQREYDTSELPVFITALKVSGVIGLIPLISYTPMLIISRNPKDFLFIFGILIWLCLIGCIVALMLKLRAPRTS